MKKFLNFLKSPSLIFLIIWYVLTVAAVAFAVVCLVIPTLPAPLAYVSYFLSAVTFAYTVYTLVRVIPRIKDNFKNLAHRSKFFGQLVDDYSFRTLMFAIGSLGICVANAIYNAYFGISRGSIWYGALAAYYLMLVTMRSVVLNYHRRKRRLGLDEEVGKRREASIYRTCGILLVLLPICLYFAIIPMVLGYNSFSHPGLMIYVSALYAFVKIIMSIYNTVKAHKNDDYTVRAIRCVNLADAMVSILALQTAMFMEFSPNASFNGPTNGITGAAVCILTVAVGTFMIVAANRKIKQLRAEAVAMEG